MKDKDKADDDDDNPGGPFYSGAIVENDRVISNYRKVCVSDGLKNGLERDNVIFYITLDRVVTSQSVLKVYIYIYIYICLVSNTG